MPPLRNLWRYYPERKGLCTGIVLAFFGLSAVIFNYISNIVINPNRNLADKETQFYCPDTARNVPTFFFYVFLITIVVGIFSVFLILPFEEEKPDNYIKQVDEEVILNKYFFIFKKRILKKIL
jgi:hypothetical protein